MAVDWGSFEEEPETTPVAAPTPQPPSPTGGDIIDYFRKTFSDVYEGQFEGEKGVVPEIRKQAGSAEAAAAEVGTGAEDIGAGEVEVGAPPMAAPAADPAAAFRLEQATKVRGFRAGRPPAAPKLGGAMEDLASRQEARAGMMQEMTAKLAEEQGKIQRQVEGSQVALQQQQTEVEEYRNQLQTLNEDRVTALLHPNIPAGVESPSAWVEEQKALMASGSPEEKEAAQERLEKAQSTSGYDEVFGEWWQVLIGAVSLAMGAFGSALAGGPNQAAQIIFKTIDRKAAEKKARAQRMQKALAARERRVGVEMEWSQQDLQRELQDRTYEIQKATVGLEKIKILYEGKIDVNAIDATIAELRMKGEQWEAQYALNRWSQGKEAELAEAKLKLSTGRGARPLPVKQAEFFGQVEKTQAKLEEMQEAYKKLYHGVGPIDVVFNALSMWAVPGWGTSEKEYAAAREAAGRFIYRSILKDRMSNVDAEWATKKLIGSPTEPMSVGLKRFETATDLIKGLAEEQAETLRAAGFDMVGIDQYRLNRGKFEAWLKGQMGEAAE